MAGFNLSCVIYEHEKKFFTEKFIKMLKDDYSGFISHDTARPDFTIKIIFLGRILVDIKKNPISKNMELFKGLFQINEKKRIVYIYDPPGNYDFEFLLQYITYKYLLPLSDAFYMHGSFIGNENKAFVFTGREGAGKSTTAQLLNGLCDVLGDDTLIIRKEKNNFYAYQTMQHEKNYNFDKSNKRYLVNKVFFIIKAKRCLTEEITDKELILDKILKQLFVYDEKQDFQFPVITEFVNKTDFYYLYVKKDEKVFKNFFRKEILKL